MSENHVEAAHHLWNSGNRQEAIKSLLSYSDIESVRSLVWMYAERGDLKNSLKYARDAVGKGKTARDQAMLALVYLDHGNANKAAIQLWISIAKDNSCDLAFYGLAAVYLKWGDKVRSLDAINKALHLDPHNAVYQYMHSYILEKFGEKVAALNLLKNIDINQLGQQTEERVLWSFYRLANTPDQKIYFLQRVLETTPSDNHTRKDVIRLLIKEIRVEDALVELKNLTRYISERKDWEYHLLMGDCFSLNKDYPSALMSYQNASDLKPDLAFIQMRLGDTLSLIGRSEDAIDGYINALELPPNDMFPIKSYLPLQKDEKISTNTMIATESIGQGPDYIFSGVKTGGQLSGRIISLVVVFVLAGLILSMPTGKLSELNIEQWISGRFFATTFMLGATGLFLWLLWNGLKNIRLHPRYVLWQLFLIVVYLPAFLSAVSLPRNSETLVDPFAFVLFLVINLLVLFGFVRADGAWLIPSMVKVPTVHCLRKVCDDRHW